MGKLRFVHAMAVVGILLASGWAQAQRSPTASQDMELSAWGGVNGSYTGVYGSKNLSVTAGAAVAFKPFHGIRPALEVRGTYPINNGDIAAERNALIGVTFSKNVLPRLDIYGDFFFGRGRIDYQHGGLVSASGTFVYVYNYSNVFSPGGGVEFRVTRRISLKADLQLQRYETPFTQTYFPVATPVVVTQPVAQPRDLPYIVDTPGHAVAKAGTVGVKYRFNFNRHRPR